MAFKTSSPHAFDSSSLSIQSRVESIILSKFNKSLLTNHPIKIGVELEFFIKRKDQSKITMEDSRRFMLEVSGLPGWKLYPDEADSRVISRVSYEIPGVGYHSLKYEHPPHMLEIAFAPYSNLHELYEAMLKLWSEFETAARKAHVLLEFVPSIEAPVLNWTEISKFSPKYRALADSREKLVELNDRKENWVHFSTYTAATQFHIGGVKWWQHESNLVARFQPS